MPTTLLIPPDVNAVSFIATVAAADALLAEIVAMPGLVPNLPATPWLGSPALTEAVKIATLKLAARQLWLAELVGVPRNGDQPLPFPRSAVPRVSITVDIPDGVAYAQVVQAACLVSSTAGRGDLSPGVRSESLGSRSVQYDLARVEAARGSTLIFSQTHAVLRAYGLAKPGSVRSMPTLRG